MNNHVNGIDAADDIDTRLEAFRQSDIERERLTQDIVRRYRDLQAEYQDKCNDLESEKMSRRTLQSQMNKLKGDVADSRQQTESNAFVLSLIDGDGAIFHDKFLTAAGPGGSEAGHMLYKEIKQQIQAQNPDASPSWPIMVQIYCNFEGLARKLVSLGVLKGAGEFLAFAREFNLSQPLFSMVDVGSGKERADHKIKEMLRLYIQNVQCKHLLFGGCHDNGYLVNLKQYQHEQSVVERMILLETTNAEPAYKQLKWTMTSFPSVFQSEPLPNSRPMNVSAAPFSTQTQAISPQPVYIQASPPPVSPASYPPPATQAAPASSSYASVGAVDGTKEISITPTKPLPAPKYILLNSYDQRVDEHLPRVDGSSMTALHDRINRQKLCNNYHLLGKCPNGTDCQYQHGEPLSPRLLLALRHKVRGLTCPRGSDCRDFDCQLRHICPKNFDCENYECRWGDMHEIDTTPAVKEFEDGRFVPLSEHVSR